MQDEDGEVVGEPEGSPCRKVAGNREVSWERSALRAERRPSPAPARNHQGGFF